MKRLKVMTIVGTRPELIRLSEIIKKADRYFNHVFVHTGQNYDTRLNDIFYDNLGIRKPDYYLNVSGHSLGETIGNIITKTYALMEEINPDALLILGDTNSALSSISAKRLKVPIFHMEAGNRCFDENLPEETNRRIVDHISDVNLPYTEHARRNLMKEGIRQEYIFVTGSPMKEVFLAHQRDIEKSNVLNQLKLDSQKYFVLSAHREENIDNEKHFKSLVNAINLMAETYQLPVIYTMHPRSAKYIEQRKVSFHPLVQKMLPFNFTDYSFLMKNAYCVISDSGTMPEEAAISHFPAVCIRTSTERPEAMDKGNFVLAGIKGESLLQSIDMAVNMIKENEYAEKVMDYEVNTVSSIVIRLIQSYTRIVDEKIWGK